MEPSIVQLLADSSVGLVLAILVVYWIRKDGKQRLADEKERMERERTDKLLLIDTLHNNTVVLTELTVLLKRRNGM